MSAFLVSNEHLNMIITWAIDNGGRDMSPQDWKVFKGKLYKLPRGLKVETAIAGYRISQN
jgi:hypothetical protein